MGRVSTSTDQYVDGYARSLAQPAQRHACPYAASVVRNENRAIYEAEIRQVVEFTRCFGGKTLRTSYELGWLCLTSSTTSFVVGASP